MDTVKIVVLDDGETWGGAAQILTISRDAYNRLCQGEELCDLTDDDVIGYSNVDTESK